MRVGLPILLILTLAGAYVMGRSGVGAGDPGAGSNPDLASLDSFRASLEQPDALERSYRFHGFLRTLSPSQVGEAAEVVEARNPWLVEDELLNFMIAWTRFDAPAAFEWALSRSGAFRRQASAAALDAWAFHDSDAARRALESVDHPGDRAGLEEYFVAGWLRGGIDDEALEYIVAQPPGDARQRYTNLLTIELMRIGPDAVVRWAGAIPDDAPGSYKRMAFEKAANILAAVDPIHASRWIEPHLGRDYAEGAPYAIARRWLDVDPPAALAWLVSLPGSAAHDDALRTALRIWRSEAPEAAEAWVRDSADEEHGSVAIAAMISLHGDDPPAAIGWAGHLADRADRYREILRLARRWHRRDPEASERWLAESGLPEAMQNAILSPGTAQRRGTRRDASDAAEAGPGRAS